MNNDTATRFKLQTFRVTIQARVENRDTRTDTPVDIVIDVLAEDIHDASSKVGDWIGEELKKKAEAEEKFIFGS